MRCTPPRSRPPERRARLLSFAPWVSNIRFGQIVPSCPAVVDCGDDLREGVSLGHTCAGKVIRTARAFQHCFRHFTRDGHGPGPAVWAMAYAKAIAANRAGNLLKPISGRNRNLDSLW